MVCQSCGYSAAQDAFCSRCGARVQAAPPNATPNSNQNPVPMYGVPPGVPPPMAYQPRVERHMQTLASCGASTAPTARWAGSSPPPS